MRDPAETARKMDALGLWDAIMPYNWAVRPRGTVFPYFCTALKDGNPDVKMHFLMLEGWQTIHDFIRSRVDPGFGFYSSPIEMPHFELLMLANGRADIFRHDPGYLPRQLTPRENELVSRILWECYGVMMRIESDPGLPMKFSGERAMFSRVEREPGRWEDDPLAIQDPLPHVEKISFRKEDVARAKDLPFAADESIELDFRLVPALVTREPRPRCAYILCALDGRTGERLVWNSSSVGDGGLAELWESMPPRLLRILVERGRIPGRIDVMSQRVFRMLRPLCMELPFRLSLHDSLPRLDRAYSMRT